MLTRETLKKKGNKISHATQLPKGVPTMLKSYKPGLVLAALLDQVGLWQMQLQTSVNKVLKIKNNNNVTLYKLVDSGDAIPAHGPHQSCRF